jgi:hypothetical protein
MAFRLSGDAGRACNPAGFGTPIGLNRSVDALGASWHPCTMARGVVCDKDAPVN